MMGDILNSYLNAETKEKIYPRAGPKFELVVIMVDGTLLWVIKVLNLFTHFGNIYYDHLSHTLSGMGFNNNLFDPDVWTKGSEGG